MKFKRTLLSTVLCVFIMQNSFSQTEIFESITPSNGTNFPQVMELSDDGSRIATMRSYFSVNGDMNEFMVFELDGGNWTKIFDSNSIPFNPKINFISLAGDGKTLAVSSADSVFIYSEWDGWATNPAIIPGSSTKVRLNTNGDIIAISDFKYDSTRGKVKVYNYNSSAWQQIGGDLIGEQTNMSFGRDIAISDDGEVLVVGAPSYTNEWSTEDAGATIVYNYSGNTWTQVAREDGHFVGHHYGSKLSLSSDGSRLASAQQTQMYEGDDFGYSQHSSFGEVIVYDLTSSSMSISFALAGSEEYHIWEYSIDLSADGNVLAVSSNDMLDDSLNATGVVKLFNRDGNQIASDILGLQDSDLHGSAISLSGSGDLLASAARWYNNPENPSLEGLIRFFEIKPEPPTLIVESAPNSIILKVNSTSYMGVDSVQFERSSDGINFDLIKKVDIQNRSFEDTSVVPNINYFYRAIYLVSGASESDYSTSQAAAITKTWYVSLLGNNSNVGNKNKPLSTIQNAIGKAVNTDTILVNPGTYTENVSYLNKDLYIKSTGGPDSTVIKPLNRGVPIVWFPGGQTESSIFDGFTLRNGGELRGSAINIQGADPIIRNVRLFDNKGEAAINSWDSSPYLENCVIDGSNTSIFFDTNPANPVINHCTLLSGLINNQSYTPVVTNSIIMNGATGNLSINNSIVEGGFPGTNIYDVKPFLSDTSVDDYRLSPFSPAIGLGSTSINSATDIEGNLRPNPSGSNPDLGAYESMLSQPDSLPIIGNLNASNLEEFSVKLGWSDNQQFTLPQSFFKQVTVYRGASPGTISPHDTLTNWYENTYVDNLTTPDTLYYALSITDINGREGGRSEILEVIPPDLTPQAPQNQLVTLADTNVVRVQFDIASETDYNRSIVNGGPQPDNLSAADTLFIENGKVIAEFRELPYQTTWFVQALHVDLAGNKSDTTAGKIRTGDPIAPDKPTGIEAQAQPGQVNLSWQPSNEADLAFYRIYRGTDSTNVSLIDSVETATTSFTDNAVTNAVTYYYRISAIDSVVGDPSVTFDPANESALSQAVSATPPDLEGPGAPTILSSSSSNGRVSISWEALTAPDLGGYVIWRGDTQGGMPALDGIDTVGVETTSYTDNTVTNGVAYSFAVSGFDTVGNDGELSELVEANPSNARPRAAFIDDISLHAVPDSVALVPLSAEGSSDADGTIDSTLWYSGDQLISNAFSFDYSAQQGTTPIQLVVKDNNEGSDTTTFNIHVSAGYRSFSSQNADNAGVSLIGSNYLFYPLSGGFMQIMDNTFRNRFDLSVGGEIRSVSSVAPDTTIYLASTDRVVYSFDRRGIPQWNTPLGGELQATPTIDTERDLVYVGVSNSNLFAVDRATGDVVWSYRLQNPLTQPAVIIENRYLLIITQLGEASYFDLDGPVTNQELAPSGSLTLGDSLSTAPAIDAEGFIFASTSNGNLIKFEFQDDLAGSGQVIWETQTTGQFNASPVIGYDGTVYVGSSDSTLYAFDGSQGNIKWRFKTEAPIATTATINEFGIIYVGDESGKVYAIDELGNQLWYYLSGGAIGNAMAYSDGNIIFSTLQGEVFKIYDGWRFESQLKAGKIQAKMPQWGTYQANNRRSGNTADQMTVSSEELENIIPTEYILAQNYPNPFNPSTQITYSIPETSPVRIEVFNSLGQKVSTLVDQLQNAGSYTVTFDASNVSSGVYFYRIEAGSFSQTMKMLLMK